MTLKELLTGGGSALLILATLLQIAPIKINPWSWLAKNIGKALNGEVVEKVDSLERNVEKLRSECEERAATNCRTRILHFGDEILHNVRHSKEHFDQILIDITDYEQYCSNHPHFKNNVAVATIKRITEVYEDCVENNDFLE